MSAADFLAAVTYRCEVAPADSPAVRELVESTGFFNAAEIDIAQELVDERLAKGPASGYEFLLAETGGQMCGYACWGAIAGTEASFDLYWVAVHRRWQGHGLGKEIVRRVEQLIAGRQSRRIYIETSGRQQYAPTRAFYERCGYRVEAELADFYAPGDAKVILVKVV